MWGTRASTFVLVAGSLTLLNACQMVGPVSIDQGRDRYNHIIETTSKEQTFANILRVYRREPTLFMDVIEVDATTTLSGTANGAVTNIGAKAGTSGGTLAGQTGGAGGGVIYSKSPVVRYQPLLGQALVAQLATPVSADALGSLFDSSWDVAPLLDLSTSFLTLDSDEFYAALNIIAELNSDRRLELIAEKSDLTKTKDSVAKGKLIQTQAASVTLEVTNKSSTGTGSNDSLVIYYLPYHPHEKSSNDPEKRREDKLWAELRVLYAKTQPMRKKNSRCTSNNCTFVPVDPNRIELRTMPVSSEKMPNPPLDSGGPLMRTYSALGILKNAIERPWPKIGFVTPGVYSNIRGYAWNDFHTRPDLSFYTLLRCDENEGDESEPGEACQQSKPQPKPDKITDQGRRITGEVEAWLRETADSPDVQYLYPKRFSENDFVKGNERLGHLRRYILIIVSDTPPANAYVAYFDHGAWYSIDGEDEISQKNFDLISLLMTMMAVPSATPPLSPTINVGGM